MILTALDFVETCFSHGPYCVCHVMLSALRAFPIGFSVHVERGLFPDG